MGTHSEKKKQKQKTYNTVVPVCIRKIISVENRLFTFSIPQTPFTAHHASNREGEREAFIYLFIYLFLVPDVHKEGPSR